jgi:hypothetical protein
LHAWKCPLLLKAGSLSYGYIPVQENPFCILSWMLHSQDCCMILINPQAWILYNPWWAGFSVHLFEWLCGSSVQRL